MQNVSTTHRNEIRCENVIAVLVGQAKTCFIDTRDIAAVAVRMLTEDAHANKAYTLTGGEALDYYQVADILSAVLQRQVRYTDPAVPVFLWRQIASKQLPGFALVVTVLYTLTRFGLAQQCTPELAQVLGRAPITLRQFAADYAEVWQPPGAAESA